MDTLGSYRDPNRKPDDDRDRRDEERHAPQNGEQVADEQRADGDAGRPKMGMDAVIGFIYFFPLRLFVAGAGFVLLGKLAAWRDTLSGDELLMATICYLLGFGAVLWEAVTGVITSSIKGALVRTIEATGRQAGDR